MASDCYSEIYSALEEVINSSMNKKFTGSYSRLSKVDYHWCTSEPDDLKIEAYHFKTS
jgi:hypothetical protein